MAIETAAMEDLLEQILKQAQAQSAMQAVSFAKLAKASGLDPKAVADAQAKLKKLGDAAEDSSSKVNHMASAGKVVGSVLADLTTGIANTVGNLVAFSAKALSGTSTISDLFMAFKDLPIIGVVAGLFANLAKIQEENLATYRNLSKSGVNFGQSINELRLTAISVGLSLDQFQKIIGSSADAFALMGTTANDGAKNFKNINLELTRTGGVGEQLKNLGYGFEDMNLLTASYVRVTGGLSKQQQQDYKSVAVAVAEYGKELDLIARITGRSREQQEKELEEQMKEANWQAFLSTKDDATRKKLQLTVNEALANAGKGGADIVKASAQGLTAQSEQAAMIYSLGGDLSGTIQNTTKLAMDKTIQLADFQEGSAKRLATGQYQAADAYSRGVTTFNALAQGGDKLGETIGPLANAFAKNNLNQVASLEEAQANAQVEANLARKEAETRSSSLSAALALEDTLRRLNLAFAQLGEVLIDRLLNPLIKVLNDHMPEIEKGITDFAKVLQEWIPKLFNPEGRQEIIDKVIAGLTYILGAIATKTGEVMFHQNEKNSSFQNSMNAINSVNPFAYLQRWLFPNADPFASPSNTQPSGAPSSGRAATTFGTTGQLFENFGNGESVTLHGTEGVFTPQQLQGMMDGSLSNKLKASIDELNTTNKQILQHMMAVAENTGRTVQATTALNGNMLA